MLDFASGNQSVQKRHRTAERKWDSLLTGRTQSLPAALFTPTTTTTTSHTQRFAKKCPHKELVVLFHDLKISLALDL